MKVIRYGAWILLLLALLAALPFWPPALEAQAAEPRAGHSHPICGDSSCTEHESIEWRPLSSVSTGGNYYLPPGYYYLTNDIVLSNWIVTSDNSTTVICLNGYAIRGRAYYGKDTIKEGMFIDQYLLHVQADNNSYFDDKPHSKLIICDCRPNSQEHWLKEINDRLILSGSKEECDTIDKYYGLDKKPGWVSMKDWEPFRGGAFISSTGASTLEVMHNTDLTIYGGTFMGANHNYNLWDGVTVKGDSDVAWTTEGPTTVNLCGGTITQNRTYGIRIPVNYKVSIKGSPKIYGNTEAGLYLDNCVTRGNWDPFYPPIYVPPVITLSEALGNEAYIEVHKRFLSKKSGDEYDQYEVVLAQGVDGYQITEADRDKFHPLPGYQIELIGNELILYQGHKHDVSMDCAVSSTSSEFEMLTSKTLSGGTLPAGSYFLAEDVALEQPIVVTGEVNFCLCGRQLSMKQGNSGSIFRVEPGGRLNLCDCRMKAGGYTHKLTVDGEEKTFTGGLLTGGNGENGGAVCVEAGGEAVVYGINMAGNTASENGGAVYVADGGRLSLTGKRYSSGSDIEKGLLQYNQAARGGAVWNGGEAALATAEVSYSTAGGEGGGIWNGGTLTLEGVTVYKNGAGTDGGGVWNGADGTLNMPSVSWSSHFSSNTSQGSGGGVYNAGSWQAPTNISVTANTAQGDGGGVCNTGTLAWKTLSLERNTAVGSGGGLYNAGAGASDSMGNSIKDNKAASGGGIYNTGSGELSLTGTRTTIQKNRAAADGGGVYNAGELTLTNISTEAYDSTQVLGNHAAQGTGFYITAGASCRMGGNFSFQTSYNDQDGTEIPRNRIYLQEGAWVTVTDALTERVKLTMEVERLPEAGQKVLLAEADEGFQNGVLTEAEKTRFTAANSAKYEIILEDGRVWLSARPPHIHDGITYDNALEGDVSSLSPGNYYLVGDVTTSGISLLSAGDVRLCLNGHTIKLTGTGRNAITAYGYGRTLHLYDCGESGCVQGTNSYSNLGIYVHGGKAYVHGGTITGFQIAGIFVERLNASLPGECSMYDGVEIYGCSTGIKNYTGGIFDMYGGSVHDNASVSSNSSGGVYNTGTFTMHGGSIAGNSGTQGGGVLNETAGTFTLAGEVTVEGNTLQDGTPCNIYLAGRVYSSSSTMSKFTIGEGFAVSGRRIGVTSQLTPTAELPIPVSTANSEDYSAFFVSDDMRYQLVNSGEGSEQVLELIPGEHEFGPEWKSDDDSHWQECECGAATEPLPHTWDKGAITKPPTADSEGEKTYTCTKCGRTKTETVPKKDSAHTHEFGPEWQSDKDTHWQECECGAATEPAPHTWDEGAITTPPTGSSEGEKTYTCTECGRTRTETVPRPDEPAYVITGTVTDNDDNPLDGVRVELKQGSKLLDSTTTQDGGQYQFRPVPRGLYNVVATQAAAEDRDEKIMTTWVRITNAAETAPVLRMPRDGTNSVLDVEDNRLTPDVVVAGLAKEADLLRQELEQASGELRKLTIQMTVEGKPEETAENASEIREQAGQRKKLSFMEIGVTLTVVRQDSTQARNSLTETGGILRIVVPFDFTGKQDVSVYRFHGEQAETLRQLSEEVDEAAEEDEGCYFADRENNLIHIYARKFSTYAIGYQEPEEKPAFSGGSGFETSSYYRVRLPAPDHGAVDINSSTMSSAFTENGDTFRKVRAGREVTLVLTPEAGYRTANVRVLDSTGEAVPLTLEDGVYSYVQPERDVTVWALFSPHFSGGDCPRDETCPIWPYADAETQAWYHDGVHYCIEETLMIGVGPEAFAPDGTLSRGMMAQILYNRAGRPGPKGYSPFSDVGPEAWYYDAVVWGAENNILLGYADGSFGPDDAVTREQMAAMLWRSSGSPAVSHELAFSDAAEISGYAAPALRWAAELGVLNGYGDGTLCPRNETSRAEAAQMLLNYFGKLGAVLFLPEN